MNKIANRFGVQSEVHQIRLEELSSIPIPYIVHLDLSGQGRVGHYLTVVDCSEDEDGAVVLRYFDGADLTVNEARIDELQHLFSGFVLRTKNGRKLWIELLVLVVCSVFGYLACAKMLASHSSGNRTEQNG